jgi:hypothetical protein
VALGTNVQGELLYSLAYHISAAQQALVSCRASGNAEWEQRWAAKLADIERNYLPSGAGIDSGTTIRDDIRADRIVLETSFHHMNDDGMYDGWTDHVIVVRPTFCGLDVEIKGRNRNRIKEYLADVFHETLSHEYPMSEFQEDAS